MDKFSAKFANDASRSPFTMLPPALVVVVVVDGTKLETVDDTDELFINVGTKLLVLSFKLLFFSAEKFAFALKMFETFCG